ncbi:MAG: hypothetical protein Q4A64_06685 [Porphyromonadaceae bacterium]|nr:hypothetical protein [Porphyromonadaceae bacterium]
MNQDYLHLSLNNDGSPKGSHTLHLPISKSLMARRLILASLGEVDLTSVYEERDRFPEDIRALLQALEASRLSTDTICVGESGTAMRFMTAYLAVKTQREVRLEGTARQHERPIAPLVDALRQLGAKIDYMEGEGYPPLLISPAKMRCEAVELDASASSQYLSALMLIGACIEGENYRIDVSRSGLASTPYALMTLEVMREQGVLWRQTGQIYEYIGRVEPSSDSRTLEEADWTAASYAYELVAISAVQELYLPNLFLPSLQGDSLYLPEVFEGFGIKTELCEGGVRLSKVQTRVQGELRLDCSSCPDLVPTLVATCVALGRSFSLEGVAHLRIKESDRLEALRLECAKVGAKLQLYPSRIAWDGAYTPINNEETIVLCTHSDHRMAMALAPAFVSLLGAIRVVAPEVVAKSFPNFWSELGRLGWTEAR